MRCRRSDSFNGTVHGGFTLVELLTLIAVAAVLVTLLAATVANSRVRQQQTVCMRNLSQVARAVQLYTVDTGKRPRSLSRVMTHAPADIRGDAFICPSDPVLRGPATKQRATNLFWGNYASASQEPWDQGNLGDPESGSWTAELTEVTETKPFSYLHPLGWRRAAWQRLMALGADTGIAVCQLHGVKVPPPPPVLGFKPYLQYEGQVFRASRDGSVGRRKVFRPGATTDGPAGSDYPWEFYADVPPVTSR